MLKSSNLKQIAFNSFFIGSTIGISQVNLATFDIFPLIRTISFLICSICIFLLFALKKIPNKYILSPVILLFLYAIGFLNFNKIILIEFEFLYIITVIIIVIFGALLLHLQSYNIINNEYYLIQLYFFLVLFFIYMTGGITLFPVPYFHFDAINHFDKAIIYSQGVTKFFGLSAIFALWSTINMKWSYLKFIFVFLFCIFMFISFIGGGRGDFAMLIAVIFLIISSLKFRTFLFSFAFGSLALLIFISSFSSAITESTAFMRFQTLFDGDSFGMRDILFSQSFDFLMSEPNCLLFGCGFAAFQEYYFYPYGFYPHNIAIEALITWGLIIMVPLIWLFVKGISVANKSIGVLFWVGIYFIFVGMKSGDLINSWFAMSFFVYVVSAGAFKTFDVTPSFSPTGIEPDRFVEHTRG